MRFADWKEGPSTAAICVELLSVRNATLRKAHVRCAKKLDASSVEITCPLGLATNAES